MPTAFTDADLDKLEAYIRAEHRIDATLPADAIQGLFAAISCTTNDVPREKWLPAVLGESHAFETPEDARDITDVLERFRADTARQLNEGEGFDFILYGEEGDDELASWADGFLLGVDLAEPPWEDLCDPEDYDNILYPFLVLTGDARANAEESGQEWMSEDEERKLIGDIRGGLADHLLDIRAFWFEKAKPETVRREGDKVGRNDPCPCGSGKKYKACHGAQ